MEQQKSGVKDRERSVQLLLPRSQWHHCLVYEGPEQFLESPAGWTHSLDFIVALAHYSLNDILIYLSDFYFTIFLFAAFTSTKPASCIMGIDRERMMKNCASVWKHADHE